jgi:polar amino acid transport system substrate-binding protein
MWINRRQLARGLAYIPIGSVAFALTQVDPLRAGEALDRIKKAGKVTVGTEAAFPPFEFVKDGKITGFGKDILDLIIADMNVELNQLDTPFQGIFPGLLAGKFDFVATALLMSDQLVKRFAFTMPIAEGSSSTMKRKGDARINSTADFNGKVIGTQLGTGSEKLLREVDAKFRAEGKPGLELKLFNSMPEAYIALANGQIDAATSLLPQVRAFVATQPNNFEVVGPVIPGRREYIGWVTRPEDTDLRDYLSSQIKGLRDSGKPYEIQDKWFGFRMEIPDTGYMPAGGI